MQATSTTNSVAKTATKSTNIVFGLAVVAVLFLSFAVVSWVAANWPHMTTDARLTLVQAVFLAAIVLAVISCWRNKKITLFALQFATLMTGALLALIGQIYQTGADVWTLFALWALLITPWVLFFRDLFIILVWAFLINLSVYLYSFAQFDWQLWIFFINSSLALVVVNTVLLVLSQLFSKWLSDPWFVLRRTFTVATFGWLLIYLFSLPGPTGHYWWQYLLSFAFLSAFYLWFTRKGQDLVIVAFTFLTAIIGIFSLIGNNWLSAFEAPIFFAAIIIICGVLAVTKLHRLANSKAGGESANPWYLFVLRAFILLLVSILLIAWLIATFEFFSLEQFLVTGVFLIIVGLVFANLFMRLSAGKRTGIGVKILFECSLAAIFVGLIVFIVGWVLTVDAYVNIRNVAVIVAVCAAVYAGLRSFLLRFLSAGFGLVAVVALVVFNNSFFGDAMAISLQQNLYLVLLFWLLGLFLWSLKNISLNDYFRPLAWALLLVALGYAIFIDIQNELPVWAWSYWYMAIVAISSLIPLLLLLPVFKRFKLPKIHLGLILILLALASITWSGAFTLSISLSLVAWAVLQKHRPLLFIAVITSLLGLALYYFQVSTTLVVKALQIGVAGALIVLSVVLLKYGLNLYRDKGLYLRVRKSYPAAIVFGAILVLGVGMYMVDGYKNILRDGTEVVLELAPVDPRSLMQGDYMQLSYKVSNEAYALLRQNPDLNNEIRWQDNGWLVLKKGADGVWDLAGISTNQADAREQSTAKDQVAIAFKLRDYAVQFGANAWFFPEGTGEKYASAKYGVLRVNQNGTALLAGMLDDIKP